MIFEVEVKQEGRAVYHVQADTEEAAKALVEKGSGHEPEKGVYLIVEEITGGDVASAKAVPDA